MKHIKIKPVLLILSAILIFGCAFVFAGRLAEWFPFRRKDALDEWEEKIFKGRVLYTVKVGRRDGYLRAYSKGTSSGIVYKLQFDPKRDPMVSWKWKVVRFPDKRGKLIETDSEWVERDDYAARFYVIFPKLAFNLTKTLEYVWDSDLPEGTIMTSPYSDYIKIIVAESGKKNLKKWVLEERNIYEDYKKAFNREPGKVGAIAIMTDTDNTASTAEAHYDEIKVGYKK